MEPDRITRVYITSPEHDAWLVYPENIRFRSRLKGPEAAKVLKRADFYAHNIEVFRIRPNGSEGNRIENEWLVRPKGGGKFIDVQRKWWKYRKDRKYGVYNSKLAKDLEKISRKKGLTIVIVG